MVPTMYDMVEASYQGKDIDTMGEAIPTFIVMLEGMIPMSPKNQDLLTLVAQLNALYGMAFIETEDPERAKILYDRAVELGQRALKHNKKFRKALEQKKKWRVAVQYLEEDDVPAIFWTLLAWGLKLQISLDDPNALFDLPKVTALLNRIMELDETYFFGTPHLLQGAIYTLLPSMAGGGPEKAQASFDRLFEISGGRYLLGHVYYAQTYAVLVKDKALFESELQFVLDTPADVLPEMPVANYMAKRAARDLLAKEDELF